MSKTGGGPGSNQHGPKGIGKAARSSGNTSRDKAEATGVPPLEQPVPEPAIFDPINQPYGSTPVDEESRQDLLPEHRDIKTMAELNALESANIVRGLLWTSSEGFDHHDLLNQNVLNDIHQKMFEDVWEWAGQIRRREMTIGIDPNQIREQWKMALDDAAFFIERQEKTPAEIVLRLHHRTVQIHPYVNGNGRHARLMSEELAFALGLDEDAITWGQHLGLDNEALRRRYLKALRAVDEDRNEIGPLMGFALDPNARNEWD